MSQVAKATLKIRNIDHKKSPRETGGFFNASEAVGEGHSLTKVSISDLSTIPIRCMYSSSIMS